MHDEAITGVLTVNPITDRCDEISTLFVDPAHRRKKVAQSLLSVATADILAAGRIPAYSGDDRDALTPLLGSIGYSRVTKCWYHYN